MREDEEREKDKSSYKMIWSILMFFIYMAIAYFVLFTPILLPYNYQDNLPENDSFAIVRYILGIAIFAYGIFRGYRVIKYKK